MRRLDFLKAGDSVTFNAKFGPSKAEITGRKETESSSSISDTLIVRRIIVNFIVLILKAITMHDTH